MKSQAQQSKAGKRHGAKFTAVRTGSKKSVKGISERNGRFYGQLWVVSKETGKMIGRRFPLLIEEGVPARNVTEAKTAYDILREKQRKDQLPTGGHKPTFPAYVKTYFSKATIQQKKSGTLENERQALARWDAHLGDVRIDRVKKPMLAQFVDKRTGGGASARTVNLDLIALRNLFKAAVEDGYLREDEAPQMKGMKTTKPPKKRALTPDEFTRLLAGAKAACRKNAGQFIDYLKFLAFTGAREQEALKVRWDDVDFSGETVKIGFGGVSKNSQEREVDFNDQLGEHLRDMEKRRAPDSKWLFPSPQRGTQDEHAKTFRESLKLARTAARLEEIAFHDLRHMFASYCVMSAVDFMTIGKWLGHQDGGKLVCDTYGHLLDEHKKRMAKRAKIGLAVVAA